MRGKFLGQGFALKEGAEIEYDIAFSNEKQIAIIWDIRRRGLLYILPSHFVESIDLITSSP